MAQSTSEASRTLKIRFADIFTSVDPTLDPAGHRAAIQAWAERQKGTCAYLVSSRDTSVGGARTMYGLYSQIPWTNQGVVRAKGWLGTSDNVDRHALGCYLILGHSSTHLHLAEQPDEGEEG